MLILGIETSCDETAAAVVRDGNQVLSNVISSQAIHSTFGGVVPEVASREHLKTIVPIYELALKEAGVTLTDIDLVAATMGPGLVGPLLVGLTFAKGLAFATDKPFVPVSHLEGHLESNIIQLPEVNSHHLSLVVSGGHTLLIEVKAFGEYVVLGETKDDAVGEAFDKVAKLMGLGYPGGAKLDKLAQSGNKAFVKFPRALKGENDYSFSYSGLKTAVALYLKKLGQNEFESHKADIAASFQEAAVEVLAEKTVRAAESNKIKHVAITGGVAANSRLRSLMTSRLAEIGGRVFYPEIKLCTDNAAMIAAAGYFRFKKEGAGDFSASAIPYLKLAEN
ncbi:MAG: tRNA (adenosine(37)-N6)-threonylcarbamoyltransferase complex transferase subunit TsaD [Candidatus Zixiibacteriota bacterium]